MELICIPLKIAESIPSVFAVFSITDNVVNIYQVCEFLSK